MSDTPITFDSVAERYPELIEAMELARQSSKAKTKNTPLNECIWYIPWGIEIDSNEPDRRENTTFEQKVQEYTKKVRIHRIFCKKGRGRWCVEFSMKKYGIPKEVEEEIHKICRYTQDMEDYWNSLSPDDRAHETQKLMHEFMSMPGTAIVRKEQGTH